MTREPFTERGGPTDAPLDLFDLELRLAGAMEDPASADRAAQIDAAPRFDEARAEIAQIEAWWARARPPLTAPDRAPEVPVVRLVRRRPRWAGLAAVGAGLALAAGALVAVLPAGVDSESHGFTARGGQGLDIVRTRAGATVPREQPIQAGDQLQVGLFTEDGGYISVTTLQDDGAVSLLAVGVPVTRGTFYRMQGRIALDGYTGREWLVVEQTDAPPSTIALEERVRSLLPDPSERADRSVVEVVEITRGGPMSAPAPR